MKYFCKNCFAEYSDRELYEKEICDKCDSELYVGVIFEPEQLELNIK